MTFQERIEKLNHMIADARRIVFFTGAGISTNSGIPDFRSEDGLYNKTFEEDPEYYLSDICLRIEPETFFDYIQTHMDFRGAEPNIAHQKISELQLARTVSVITQNIDGLHALAGSEVVDEIHGSFSRAYCQDCLEDYDGDYIFDAENIPYCKKCGGIVRPDIVLYGENLARPHWSNAQLHSGQADLFIVVGSSLTVSPANWLPRYFGNNNNLVIINRDTTPLDWEAGLVFHEDITDVFNAIKIPK